MNYSKMAMIIALLVSGVVPSVRAADHSTPAAGHASSTTAARDVLTTVGSISQLDLKASTPNLTLTSTSGKAQTLLLDPRATSLWQGNQQGKLSDLRVGQQVKIRYTMKAGKATAKSILLAQAPKPAAAASSAPMSTTSTPAGGSKN